MSIARADLRWLSREGNESDCRPVPGKAVPARRVVEWIGTLAPGLMPSQVWAARREAARCPELSKRVRGERVGEMSARQVTEHRTRSARA